MFTLGDRRCNNSKFGVIFTYLRIFSVRLSGKEVKTQIDIREALEKKVLTFMTASTYEAMPNLMVAERGISFTQLPPKVFEDNDPAAASTVLVIDYEPENPSPVKGNYLMSDSKKDYTQTFDLIYDLTNMMVIKLNISTGSQNGERNIVKFLVVSQEAKMEEFCFEMAALLNVMRGGTVDDQYNSFVLAIGDNRNADEKR